MGFVGGITKAFKSIGNFAKKAVGFASKILNGPIGKVTSAPGAGIASGCQDLTRSARHSPSALTKNS